MTSKKKAPEPELARDPFPAPAPGAVSVKYVSVNNRASPGADNYFALGSVGVSAMTEDAFGILVTQRDDQFVIPFTNVAWYRRA